MVSAEKLPNKSAKVPQRVTLQLIWDEGPLLEVEDPACDAVDGTDNTCEVLIELPWLPLVELEDKVLEVCVPGTEGDELRKRYAPAPAPAMITTTMTAMIAVETPECFRKVVTPRTHARLRT